jgi:RHH-type proline utilization regulon transcriptional repressor/proline dehydrogenase/delta 1-pyrroline-5-carboxylate dehydrogenase
MDEKKLVKHLKDILHDVDISSSIDELFNNSKKDRTFISLMMKFFPMDSERGKLAMSISESISRIPDNKNKDKLLSQLNIPLPRYLLRLSAKLSVYLLSRSLICSDNINKASKSKELSSYDMLGEAAITYKQSRDYFGKYIKAAYTVESPSEISIKLSSLHPRYEYLCQNRCIPTIIGEVSHLMGICNRRGIGLTIDAEESDRLDLSMMVIEPIVKAHGKGLTVAVQASQKRAIGVIKYLNSLGVPIGVRLVKGAYWDTEIKMAQERGLEYPVFTSKENTNISYLACAKLMLDSENIIPKFATHNPSTVGAILGLTNNKQEFQRLYGMGKSLHELIENLGHKSRVYKPVGDSKELLSYLIRRMMENGANTSFVMHESQENHLDEGEEMDSYQSIFSRNNSHGTDFSDPETLNELRCYYDRKDKESC